LLNNRYAKERFAENEEISIFFDRNFGRWTTRCKERDNLWQGVNDALRQMTEAGPANQKSRPQQWADLFKFESYLRGNHSIIYFMNKSGHRNVALFFKVICAERVSRIRADIVRLLVRLLGTQG